MSKIQQFLNGENKPYFTHKNDSNWPISTLTVYQKLNQIFCLYINWSSFIILCMNHSKCSIVYIVANNGIETCINLYCVNYSSNKYHSRGCTLGQKKYIFIQRNIFWKWGGEGGFNLVFIYFVWFFFFDISEKCLIFIIVSALRADTRKYEDNMPGDLSASYYT